MNKKSKKFIGFAVLISILVFSVLSFAACERISKYSDDEHMARVEKFVQKYYIDTGDYEGYQISKAYNDLDKCMYFIVDLEPQNFFIVQINHFFDNLYYDNMYWVIHSDGVSEPWQRYRYCKDYKEPEPYGGNIWLADPKEPHDKYYYQKPRYEADKDGNFIEYVDSPFKVAGIGDEKKYILEHYSKNGKGELGTGLSGIKIPAVKRGDKFLNLISMEEFEYVQEFEYGTVPEYITDNFKDWERVCGD